MKMPIRFLLLALLSLVGCAHPKTASEDASAAPVIPAQIHGQATIDVRSPEAGDGITHYAIAPGIGAATLALDARVRGESVAVFPVRDLSDFDARFAKDPNLPYKLVNVPLFPNTNRLLPKDFYPGKSKLARGDVFTANVEGIPVKMPANNSADVPGAIPHQLHGLLFGRPATEVRREGPTGTVAFFRDFFGPYWVGDATATVTQRIEGGAFVYEIRGKNTGSRAIPVGFGSHSYFHIPSGDPASVRIRIPARETAVIDNLDNVLPTGKWTKVAGTRLDFDGEGGRLGTEVIDNYFRLDPKRPKVVELVDLKKRIVYRMTARTPNIVGVQIYYPGHGDVVAIEMVTHHPDPRRELWRGTKTGMQVLKPGAEAVYGYRIEARPLD